MSILLGPFRNFSKIRGDIREWMFITGVFSMGHPHLRLPLPHPSVGSSSPERRGWMSRRSLNPEWRGVLDPLSPPPGPALQTLDPVLKISKLLGNQISVTYYRSGKLK
jgi:hypothetical protein